MSEYMLVLRRLKQYGSLVGMISGGEPLLHPDIIDILKQAKMIYNWFFRLCLLSKLILEN